VYLGLVEEVEEELLALLALKVGRSAVVDAVVVIVLSSLDEGHHQTDT
jgi:hypothetical protein